MWTVPGKPVDINYFQPFRPLRVLYEFDGPKTFTHVDHRGETYLAHWCDEDQEIVRYLVVPTTDDVIEQLEQGQRTLRQALGGPRVWVIDVNHEGCVQAGVEVSLSELPDDVLPKPGTMLLATLERDGGCE